ncbi:MAG TPA: hypothetical protein VNW15_03095 [Rhizomicrobium sp.]|nr:hypothetical protein [Rhizomicrobium sp.]
MQHTFWTGLVLAIAMLGVRANAQAVRDVHQVVRASPIEEIYIARSLRETRVVPTDFCGEAKTGFKSSIEDRYSFRAIAIEGSDGRITNANVKEIGSGHGCLGQIGDTGNYNFYLELRLGKTVLQGIGDCRTGKADYPEPGLVAFHCALDLTDPAGRYAGGQLTTSTMNSRKLLGDKSDPPGYVQPSIATVRLWKRRVDH